VIVSDTSQVAFVPARWTSFYISENGIIQEIHVLFF